MLKINIRPSSLIIYGITRNQLDKLYRSQEFVITKCIEDSIQVHVKNESFNAKSELYMLLWKLSTIYDIELV